MQINQKKAGVVLSYTSQIIRILSGLLYTPIMLRLLGQSEYGLYQLVNSVVSYLSLLSLGFSSSYMRFYSIRKARNDKKGIDKLNGLFMIVFLIMAAVALVAGFFMVINSESILGSKLTATENSRAKVLMGLLVVNLAVTFPDSIYNCIITAHERFFFQKLLVVLINIASPVITLPLLIAGYGSIGMVAVSTGLTFTGFFVHIFYCHRKLGIHFDFSEPDFKLLGSLSKFTFFIFLNQIVDQINWSVDKYVLGRVAGTTSIAVYGVGAQLNSLYVEMSGSISNVFVPQVNRIVAEHDDNSELTEVFTKVGRVQFLVLSLVLTGLIIFGKAFIPIWAGPGYDSSYYVLVILIVPVTIPLIQNIGIEIQRAKNKHQIRSIVYVIVAVVNIIISIPLAKAFGPAGAALGTAITMIAGNIVFMNWYYYHGIGLNIKEFWKSIISLSKGLLIPIAIGILIFNFADLHDILRILLYAVVYTFIYIFSMWKFGMNNYEKGLVRGMVRKFKRV